MSINVSIANFKKHFEHSVWGIYGNGRHVLHGHFLGFLLGLGLTLVFCGSQFYDFGLYISFFSIFHTWEWFFVAFFHTKELSTNSFLLNHSNAYKYAFLLAFFEYWIEKLLEFITGYYWKGNVMIVFLGFLMCAVGQGIRTYAMYTCGFNFTHQICEEKVEGHKLVTDGIYQYLRHPSYFGWFWWSIGMMVILSNPVSFVVYCLASWKFFADRIPFEEEELIKIFGEDYKKFRTRTPVGIPFIK